jgi:hypothetical protein
MKTFAISASFKLSGLAFMGEHTSFNLSGSYTENSLLETNDKKPAYGYLYSHEAAFNDEVLLDFNREKQVPFSEYGNLPLTNFTYDMYSITGQGIGGSFRPFRSDIGHVHDNKSIDRSTSSSLGLELGMGNTTHGGMDIGFNQVDGISGDWYYSLDFLTFKKDHQNGYEDYEPYYFKQMGEKSVDNDPLNGAWIESDELISPEIVMITAKNHNLSDKYNIYNKNNVKTQTKNYSSSNQRNSRRARTLSILPLKTEEVRKIVPSNQQAIYSGKGHSIGTYVVTKPDGTRYVYGMPLYNLVEKEVVFNVSENGYTADCSTGLIKYNPTRDPKSENGNGVDEYYSKTITPQYAHSYMLTEVLSSDYVDVDFNGPTLNDLGTYVKFSYADSVAISSYKWRIPYKKNMANFNKGLEALAGEEGDDKGNYVYGEKDVKYLTSIETKTHKAIFYLSPRDDAYEVVNEHGGPGSNSFKKLDSIQVYTIAQFSDLNNNILKPNEVPLQTVHFEYDYSLCPNVPNNVNGEGKLTLKKIYFTYNGSNKGRYTPYVFHYSGINPPYNLKGYNRWGNYKENNGNCSEHGYPSSAEFPYVEQNKSQEDLWASAWSLTGIELPSGGKIEVTYESDDYAYVQDRLAYQMIKVKGFYDDINNLTGQPNRLYNNNDDPRLFMNIELPEPVNSSTELYDLYLRDVMEKDKSYMYFKMKVDIAKSNFEYVSGYAQIMNYHVINGEAYLELKPVSINDNANANQQANPISKAAWYFGRLNLPKIVYDQPSLSESNLKAALMSLAQAFTQLPDLFQSPDRVMMNKYYGKIVNLDRSWVRLMCPTRKKLGGGSRVKQIKIFDNWDEMTKQTNNDLEYETQSDYGQEFEYTIIEGGKEISSGVAANEPTTGQDENPLRQPIHYKGPKRLLAPDNLHYVEKPIGEAFYPGASVGYSQVTVKSLSRTTSSSVHGTGKTVHTFYTAKDFPSYSRMSPIEEIHKKNKIGQLLGLSAYDYKTVSQGFIVEINDMHGKPKSQEVFPDGADKSISKVEYIYKQKSSKKLDNNVVLINPDGSLSQGEVGVEREMIADLRRNFTSSFNYNLQINFDGFVAGVLPIIVPPVWQSVKTSENNFQTATITKVIYRYGLLEKTIAHDMGSKITTSNLAYDAITGEVLVTETQNEFDDPYYTFNYPAHWIYDGMSPAYQNEGLQFAASTDNNGRINSIPTDFNGKPLLTKGDVLLDIASVNTYPNNLYWVWTNDINNGLFLIDKSGAPVSVSSNFKIIRSGHRNMQSISVGSIISKKNPIDGVNNVFDHFNNSNSNSFDVITANAVEYSEKWQSPIAPSINIACDGNISALEDSFEDLLNYYIDQNNNLIYSNQNPNSTYDSILINNIMPNSFVEKWVSLSSQCINPTTGTTYQPGPIDNVSGINFYLLGNNNGTFMIKVYQYNSYHPGTLVQTLLCKTCPFTLNLSSPYLGQTVSQVSDMDFSDSPFTMKFFSNYDNTWHTANVLFRECKFDSFNNTCDTINSCSVSIGDQINPYIYGIRGNWRPYRSYTYLTMRNQTTSQSGSGNIAGNMRKDGAYSTFSPFWKFDNALNNWVANYNNWTWTATITKYNSSGQKIENNDPLGRYSSELMGYANKLPIAVAFNARYNDIGFDGMEDYEFNAPYSECNPDHFGFYKYQVNQTDEDAHTGKYSIKLTGSTIYGEDSLEISRYVTNTWSSTYSQDFMPYIFQQTDNLGIYQPYTGDHDYTFLVSYWVKEKIIGLPTINNTLINYSNHKVKVYFNGMELPIASIKRSIIIDGWQKVDIEYTIPQYQTGELLFKFIKLNSTASSIYFDDIRVHPFNSSMKTYVYHPDNLRLVAELDENNFATIYEYDEEGALTRIKKETERGIFTLQESRNNKAKDKSIYDLDPSTNIQN